MMDFEAQDGEDFENANLIQASGNTAPPAVARSASAATQVLTANAQGVVVLPAGTEIDHIEVEGRNLVVVAEDGTRYLILDGTIVVPQLVIGDVAVPPVTLAALLEGLDIAAINTPSSGGNFAGAVGDIQAAYDLGDLLPYTELQFPGDEEREVIPDAIDREPGTTIVTPNNPAGAVMATASVSEAGLPARGSEPAGSNAASNSETTTGTIIYTAPDGLQSVTLNGVVITTPGQTVAGSFGTLTVTSVAPGAIGYTYTLADNTLTAADDVFTVTVRELDGDSATASLNISIVDDAPTARNDTDGVPASTFTGESGNVITGTGTTSGAAGADTPGADGITLTGIYRGTTGTFAAPGTIAGQYGTLTINAQGTYTYTRSANTPGGVNEVFTYRITDGDGDISTATLTIAIADAPAMVTSVPTTGGGTVVDEEGLPARTNESPGSNEPSTVEKTTGTITFVAPDGVGSVAINGTPITGPGQTITTPQGTLTIDSFNPGAGTLTYTFTLTDNTSGDATQVSLSITVTDIDGDSDTKPFVITIIDDEPTARADADSVTEDGPPVAAGNVITGTGGADANATDGVADTQGADGSSVTAVTFGATAGTVGAPLAGDYGSLTLNADGSYAYTVDGADPLVQGLDSNDTLTETFNYTLTDGDGDVRTTTLVITINGADDAVVIDGLDVLGAEEVVDEDDLSDGSSPDAAALTQDGSFTVNSQDGLATLTVNGTPVFGAGVVYPVTFSTAYGTMRVTSVATITDPAGDAIAATVNYSYTLTDNTLLHTGANGVSLTESFSVVATDTDGSSDTASLDVTVIDDLPTARSDADSVTEDGATVADGNVITGSGGADVNATDGVADTQGADGATVTSVAFGATDGIVGDPLDGTYGTLTLNADGSYSYELDNAHPLVQGLDGNDTLTELFNYRLTDGDGDSSPATLTISINGTDDGVVIGDLNVRGAEEVVYEDDLADGSSPDAAALTQDGVFTVSSPDGLATLTVNGTPVFGAGVIYPVTFATAHGTMSITGVLPTLDGAGDVIAATVSYEYVLTDNTLLHTGGNAGALTETLTVVATDTDGSVDTAGLDVTIVDDVPTAAGDADSVREDNPLVADGNVITGSGGADANATDGVTDTPGADGGSVSAVAFGATPGTVGSALSGAYGSLTLNADGSYSYTLNNAHPLVQGLDGNDSLTETFDYTLTDGDGDTSATTLTITINGANDVVVINGLDAAGAEETVYEDDLSDGSSPDAGQLTQAGTFTVDSQDGLAALTVNGTPVYGAGVVYPVTFSTPYGTMSITGVATTTDGNGDVVAATVSYSYTLTDNTLLHTGGNAGALTESFTVVATDTDGSTDTAGLDVTIVDDVPTAVPDADSVTEDGPLVADGNVITGTGGADLNATDGVIDTRGADGATVTAVAFLPPGGAPVAGTVGVGIPGYYGSLVLNTDGTYAYTLANSYLTVQGLDSNDSYTETFSYTITDGDGDPSATTLTITINGADDIVVINGLDGRGAEEIVYENDLSDGSSPDAAALTQSGSFTVDSPDGLTALTVNGTPVFGAGVVYPVTFSTTYGTMSITGITPTYDLDIQVIGATVSYSYTLTDNTLLHTGGNDGSLTDSLSVVATDSDGSTDTASLDVTVVDDVPTANNDNAGQATENVAFAINVFTNDVFGADGVDTADPTKVFVATQATYGVVTYDSGTGLFTYTPNSGAGSVTTSDSFTYTIVDRDGDASTATVNITLQPDSAPVALDVTAKIDDDGLPAGNPASNPLGSDENQNAGEVGAGTASEAVWTGTLGVSSGADTPLNYSLASATGIGFVGTEAVVYSWDAFSNTLTAMVAPPQTRAGLTLFTVKIDDPATGAYTVTLVNPIAHATLNAAPGDDTENNTGTQVQLTYTVDDADTTPVGGDADTGLITIDFDDDTPSAADYSGATFAEGTGSHTIGDAATLLGIVGGADGLSGPLSGIVFTNQGATTGTLSINGAGQLVYSSPASVTSATTVTETFSYTVTDTDGDKVVKSVTFGVSDTGVSNVSATNELVDEDDIVAAGGLAGGPGDNAPLTTGHISYTLGADALGSITLSVVSTGLTKLDGVTPVSTSWNAGTQTLTGYGTTIADVVFTITLANVTSTGADYNMVLFQPVKHPVHDDGTTVPVETSFEDDLGFTVGVSVKDADNSEGLTSFIVTIDDDSPVASDYAGATFAEGTGSHTIGNAAALLGIAGGADGLSGPLSGIVFTNQGATTGTLSINGAGNLIYVSPASVTSAVTVTETFSYTVTDADGDAVTKIVTFGVSDTGVSNVRATNETVDEDDIVGGGGAAGGPGDNAPVTSGHIDYTLGADALGSITLSVAGTGLTKLDGVTPVSTSWNAGTQTLTGYGTSPADVVFTITLANVTSTGADYNMVLFQPVKHPLTDDGTTVPVETSFEDNLSFSVGVTVTDADNSQGFTGFTIVIDDDSPTVSGTPLAAGQVTENVAFTISIVGQYAAGADGVSLATGISYTQPTQGVVTYDNAGVFTYTPNSGAGSTSTADSFTYSVTDADGDKVTRTINVTLQPDSVPVALDVAAKIDDDGLAAGNAASTVGDENQNLGEVGAGTASEAIWTGTLGVSSGGADTPLNYSLASAVGSGSVGTETVDYTWNAGSNTLTATVAAAQTRTGTVLFTVKIDDPATGAYTVTLINPISHATLDTLVGDNTENNTSVQLTYTVDDNDTTPVGGDADTGLITIDFDDDTASITAHTDLTLTGSNLSGSGDFEYVVGADLRTSFSSSNSDFVIDLSGSVGAAAITTPSITWVSESATAAEFDFAFQYDSDPTNALNPLSNASGSLTFDKVNGTYQFTLDAPIQSYTTSQTANTFNRVDYNLSGPASQSEYSVSQLSATNSIFVRFKGIEASDAFNGAGSDTTFNAGDTFQGDESYVTISGSSNGVSGDTIQGQGGEVLNVDLFTSDPGVPDQVAGYTATPNAFATGITLRLDLIGNDTDFVVVLKLADPNNPTVVLTTRAIVIDPTDIYKQGQAIPAGYTLSSPLDSNDGFVIIESNDYNGPLENYVVVGFQLVASTEGTSATGIDHNRATGVAGASTLTDTFADHDDNDVVKITDIGLIRTITTTEALHLDFDVAIQDADGDITSEVTISINPVTPPIVLDLDGDGAEFVGTAAGATFDYDGDGTAEATAWAGSDDGILAIDLDGDGQIAGDEVVFGGSGQTDLEGLAAKYDSNADGTLDAQDSAFGQFGVLQGGQFVSLAQAGIASIGLTSDGQGYTAANGEVIVHGTGTYTRADGSTGTFADAAFATERRAAEVTVATAAAGALLAPELAAAAATDANDEPAPASTLATDSGDAPAEQSPSAGDATPDKLSDLLDDSAPVSETAEHAASHAEAEAAGDLSAASDVGSDPADAGHGSEAGADFSASSGGLFQFGGGEAMMEALLVNASADAGTSQPQDLAPVQEALADVTNEATVDAIVNHFADGADAAAPLGGEIASHVLLEALDSQLMFAANGAAAPDTLDDAAQTAAAAQA